MSLMSDLRRLRQAQQNREGYRRINNQNDVPNAGRETHEETTSPPTKPDAFRPDQLRHFGRYQKKKADEVLADWTIAVAVFTGVLAAASIAGDFFSFRTLNAINGQLREMKSGGAQTDKIILADNELAKAAKAQADAADNLAKITRENTLLSQRAWVGPNGATINSTPSIGNDIVFTVTYQNTGKEPAIDALVVALPFEIEVDANGAGNLPDMDARVANCKGTTPPLGGQVIFPTTGFSGSQITIRIDKTRVTEKVVKGNTMIGLTGCISYKTFERPRHSAFCFFYKNGVSAAPNLNFCASGGFAD